jgi:CheY-like chemotaxis protein
METFLRTVLVIDDDPQARLLLPKLLGGGYRVLTVGTGEEGLRLLDQELVDLVIVDILMPEMDGLELIRVLRRTQPAMKIIAMTGGIKEWSYLEVAKHLGAHATLQKPFSQETLLAAVRAQLAT